MYRKILPHNWLGLKGLRRIFLFLFYATFAVGAYAAYAWAKTQLIPQPEWNSAPMSKLYLLAFLQAVLACAAELAVVKLLGALDKMQRTVCRK